VRGPRRAQVPWRRAWPGESDRCRRSPRRHPSPRASWDCSRLQAQCSFFSSRIRDSVCRSTGQARRRPGGAVFDPPLQVGDLSSLRRLAFGGHQLFVVFEVTRFNNGFCRARRERWPRPYCRPMMRPLRSSTRKPPDGFVSANGNGGNGQPNGPDLLFEEVEPARDLRARMVVPLPARRSPSIREAAKSRQKRVMESIPRIDLCGPGYITEISSVLRLMQECTGESGDHIVWTIQPTRKSAEDLSVEGNSWPFQLRLFYGRTKEFQFRDALVMPYLFRFGVWGGREQPRPAGVCRHVDFSAIWTAQIRSRSGDANGRPRNEASRNSFLGHWRINKQSDVVICKPVASPAFPWRICCARSRFRQRLAPRAKLCEAGVESSNLAKQFYGNVMVRRCSRVLTASTRRISIGLSPVRLG